MKQSTTNIELISSSLKLNSEEKDYLIKCNKGSGLLIGEDGHFKFQLKVPQIMHDLFTTDPKHEKGKIEVVTEKPLETPIKRFNLSEGFFFAKDLTQEQIEMCMKNGYTEMDTNPFGAGKGERILVRPPDNQSPEHYYFCRILQLEIQKYGRTALIYNTVKPDVVVFDKENIAFEVETGSHFRETDLKSKFDKIKQEFADYYILVTKRELKEAYRPYGNVITRNDIKETVARVYNNSAINSDQK